MNLKRALLGGLFGLGLPFLVIDVQAKPPVHHIPDTFEVSGTRVHQEMGETGRRIQVIEGERLEELPGQSIDDKLRYVSGIEVQSRNNFGIIPNFSIRGSTFNQVLILIDGQRLNDPLTGHFNGHIPVADEEIERIEVLKGPSAAVYGPDAVGGVINVITKTYEVPRRGMEEAGKVSHSYGENDFLSAEGGIAHNLDDLYLSAGFNNRVSDGHPIDNTENVEDSRRADFQINTISGSAGYKISDDIYLSARSGYDHRDFSAVNFYTSVPSDSSRETVAQSWNHLALQREGENSRSTLEGSYKWSTDEFEFNELAPVNEHTMNRGEIHASHLLNVNQYLTLQGGVQQDFREIESSDRGDHSESRTGGYVNALVRPLTGLSLNVSARGDHDDHYGFSFSPQMSAAYDWNSLTIRGLAGRTVRAPDFTERFTSYQLEALSEGRNLGNPDLEEETSLNFELGTDLRMASYLNFNATAFLRNADNTIDWVFTQKDNIDVEGGPELPGDGYFHATNVPQIQTRGIETSVNGQVAVSEDLGIAYESGVTLLSTEAQDEDDEGLISRYVLGHSDFQFQNSLNLDWSNFFLGLNGLYKVRNLEIERDGLNFDIDKGEGSKSDLLGISMKPDYWVFNGKAGYSFEDRPFRVHMEVNNILDQDNYDVMGARLPGRWITGGVTVSY